MIQILRWIWTTHSPNDNLTRSSGSLMVAFAASSILFASFVQRKDWKGSGILDHVTRLISARPVSTSLRL